MTHLVHRDGGPDSVEDLLEDLLSYRSDELSSRDLAGRNSLILGVAVERVGIPIGEITDLVDLANLLTQLVEERSGAARRHTELTDDFALRDRSADLTGATRGGIDIARGAEFIKDGEVKREVFTIPKAITYRLVVERLILDREARKRVVETISHADGLMTKLRIMLALPMDQPLGAHIRRVDRIPEQVMVIRLGTHLLHRKPDHGGHVVVKQEMVEFIRAKELGHSGAGDIRIYCRQTRLRQLRSYIG